MGFRAAQAGLRGSVSDTKSAEQRRRRRGGAGGGGGRGRKTHKPQTKHHQRRDGMRPQPPAKRTDIHAADDEIPEEIASGKALNHAARAGVAPDALGPGHGLALVVGPHDPQRQRVDDAALHQRHDVHVPVQLRARREGGVGLGEEVAGEERGEVRVYAVVEEEGEEDLVRVEREGREAEEVGEGLG